jgi:hypothetical protein
VTCANCETLGELDVDTAAAIKAVMETVHFPHLVKQMNRKRWAEVVAKRPKKQKGRGT